MHYKRRREESAGYWPARSYCPILGRPAEVDVFDASREPWQLVRCRETRFVFLLNPPAYSALSEEFAWEKTLPREVARRTQDEPVVARVSWLTNRALKAVFPRRNKFYSLLRAIKSGAAPLNVLDIGCGRGRLMQALCQRMAEKKRRILPVGIEISAGLAAESSERFSALGGRVIHSDAAGGISQLGSEKFDVVIMSSFLEHEARPLALLSSVLAVLKPDGCVILKVPNFGCWNRRLRGRRWCGYRFPDHVNYFTPRTLRMLARRAGFRVTRQRLRDRLPYSDNMYAVLEPMAPRLVEAFSVPRRESTCPR